MWKPTYASLTLMRDWLRIRNIEDTDDDGLLRLKLSAASRAVDGTTHRQFGKEDTPVERTYDVRWSRTLNAYVVDVDDIMDTTDLVITVDGTVVVAADYKLRPRNAIADGRPYTRVVLGGAVAVTDGEFSGLGLWGWNAPWPDEVTESTMLQASRLNIRRDSPYGIAGGADGSGELRLLARLDPDVAPLVADLVRVGWVAK